MSYNEIRTDGFNAQNLPPSPNSPFVLNNDIFAVEYNPENKELSTCLFSPFEEYVINNSLVQHHWSGRGSLGHIQFNNKVKGKNIYENRRGINIEVIRKSKVYSSMKLSK